MVVQSVTAHRKEFPVTIETGRENVFPNIEVKEDINQLEEVVVTGQFSPQSMKNSLYKVRSVNSDQIRQKAPLDVQSLLNTEIGIRLSNDMALGETDFELMGMSGNNVKILMDGIPMIDRGSTKQSLSQLDVNRIERVEIVEGPMSVVYGTDALAGVINIITKRDRAIPAKAPGAWAPASRKKRWARNTSSSTAKVFTTKASTSDSILKRTLLQRRLHPQRQRRLAGRPDRTRKALASQRPVAGQRYDRVPATQPERLVPAGFPRRENLRSSERYRHRTGEGFRQRTI